MLGIVTKSVKSLLLSIIWFYSKSISPLFPPTCRYEPTCSAYAREAITKYGPGKGLILSIKRFLRCHPFSPGGFDPVE